MYAYRQEGTAPVLVLFHGTGGNEMDLVPLAEAVAPGAAILSLRGNVSEGGALRFFRRFSEGVFDLEDVAIRVREVSAFLRESDEQHGIAMGFSNGANMAAVTLLADRESFRGAVLIRAQTVWVPEDLPDLSDKKILLLSGRVDPIVPLADAQNLAASFVSAGAEVQHEILEAGHNLTRDDVNIITRWMESNR